jgi:hypothetical protein
MRPGCGFSFCARARVIAKPRGLLEKSYFCVDRRHVCEYRYRCITQRRVSNNDPQFFETGPAGRPRLDAHKRLHPAPFVPKGEAIITSLSFGGDPENELHSVDDYFRRQTNESG